MPISYKSFTICLVTIIAVNAFRPAIRECQDSEFSCENGLQCIARDLVCNGPCQCMDCSDDDKEMCEFRKCLSNEFRCDSGQCIPFSYACTGNKHCEDGSDDQEAMCQNRQCSKEQFRCKSGQCIDINLACRNSENCVDKSNENKDICSKNYVTANKYRNDTNNLAIDQNDGNGALAKETALVVAFLTVAVILIGFLLYYCKHHKAPLYFIQRRKAKDNDAESFSSTENMVTLDGDTDVVASVVLSIAVALFVSVIVDNVRVVRERDLLLFFFSFIIVTIITVSSCRFVFRLEKRSLSIPRVPQADVVVALASLTRINKQPVVSRKTSDQARHTFRSESENPTAAAMYLKTWKEFETGSYNLLLKDPTRVRCTMKYCHSQASVQLKVTDDKTCLQFKTSEIQNVKKIEVFYSTIMKQITSSEF